MGFLLVTIHGLAALKIIRDSVPHQMMFNLDRKQSIEIIENIKVKKFVFHKYNNDTLDIANAGNEYGTAFIHSDYIYDKWGTEGFIILDLIPGGLRGWQDIMILQRIDL